jgi:hypothetical protein
MASLAGAVYDESQQSQQQQLQQQQQSDGQQQQDAEQDDDEAEQQVAEAAAPRESLLNVVSDAFHTNAELRCSRLMYVDGCRSRLHCDRLI